jgi:hypothetical protein
MVRTQSAAALQRMPDRSGRRGDCEEGKRELITMRRLPRAAGCLSAWPVM